MEVSGRDYDPTEPPPLRPPTNSLIAVDLGLHASARLGCSFPHDSLHSGFPTIDAHSRYAQSRATTHKRTKGQMGYCLIFNDSHVIRGATATQSAQTCCVFDPQVPKAWGSNFFYHNPLRRATVNAYFINPLATNNDIALTRDMDGVSLAGQEIRLSLLLSSPSRGYP